MAPNIKKMNPPHSKVMSQQIFGDIVVLLTHRGYNPSDIIGHNPEDRSRLEIIKEIKEFLHAI